MVQTTNEKMHAIKAAEQITVDLSTRAGVRLFKGKEKKKGQVGVIGLVGFGRLIRSIESAIKEDDPYADYYYKIIEDKIAELAEHLNETQKEVKEFIDLNTPKGLNLPNSVNSKPEVLPIKFTSRLAFLMIREILKVDQIVLDVLKANHVGMMSNDQKLALISGAERKVRGVMHKCFDYKFTGVSRDDMVARNKRAEKAISVMGELDEEYLIGTTRSPNAPALPKRRQDLILDQEPDEDALVDSLVDELVEEVVS